VDEVLATVREIGATVYDAVQRDWGGYSGYFADPDGFRREVAYNPSSIGDDVLP
jgi:predicted lactoylglutathione lyase